MKIIKLIYKILFEIFKLFPIKNKILFINMSHDPFEQNIVGTYEFLKKKNKYKVKLISMKKGHSSSLNLRGLRACYLLATSKIWIVNSYFGADLVKRKECVYIQLWHAVGAFKKFGLSIEKNKRRIKEVEQIDYLNISSLQLKKYYKEALGIEDKKIVSLGVPRVDYYFDLDSQKKSKEYFEKKYFIAGKKKKILYAPTYRDCYSELLDIKKLSKKLGEEYIILWKPHPKQKNKINETPYVFDMSDEKIEILNTVADFLITDYSSNFYEFILLNKPVLFYQKDRKKYLSQIGFYNDYVEDRTIKNFNSINDLASVILNFVNKNSNQYQRIVTENLDYRDCNSKERFYRFIKKIIYK